MSYKLITYCTVSDSLACNVKWLLQLINGQLQGQRKFFLFLLLHVLFLNGRILFLDLVLVLMFISGEFSMPIVSFQLHHLSYDRLTEKVGWCFIHAFAFIACLLFMSQVSQTAVG
jgi:hypothetical protein